MFEHRDFGYFFVDLAGIFKRTCRATRHLAAPGCAWTQLSSLRSSVIRCVQWVRRVGPLMRRLVEVSIYVDSFDAGWLDTCRTDVHCAESRRMSEPRHIRDP